MFSGWQKKSVYFVGAKIIDLLVALIIYQKNVIVLNLQIMNNSRIA